MTKRDDLVAYLDEYLRIAEIQDFGPQGLQVEGRDEVHRIVGMVDAQLPCITQALEHDADMLLVHHGIFWGAAVPLRGAFGKLVRAITAAELNLYAAHLALDAHPIVGNNVELARRLGLEMVDHFGEVNGVEIGVLAVEPDGVKVDYLVDRYERLVGPVQVVQSQGPRIVHRVGIMSGSGVRHIQEAADLGCDLFLTGETSHAHYYDAFNAGINIIYGGHYTSEVTGVQALGRHLQDEFDIDFEFVDLPTDM